MPARRVVGLAIQIADALIAAQRQKLAHGALEPASIVIDEAAVGDQVKVLDVGLAWSLVPARPGYAAPERLDGNRPDARSDLYSVGCILYELLVGAPVFAAASADAVAGRHRREPPPQLPPHVPPQLASIVMRLLAKSPGDRYATPGDLRAHLLEVQQIVGVAVPRANSNPGIALPHTGSNQDVAMPRTASGDYGNPQMPRTASGDYGNPQMPRTASGDYGNPQMPRTASGDYGSPHMPRTNSGEYSHPNLAMPRTASHDYSNPNLAMPRTGSGEYGHPNAPRTASADHGYPQPMSTPGSAPIPMSGTPVPGSAPTALPARSSSRLLVILLVAAILSGGGIVAILFVL
jgi:serine/threonine protein kinase